MAADWPYSVKFYSGDPWSLLWRSHSHPRFIVHVVLLQKRLDLFRRITGVSYLIVRFVPPPRLRCHRTLRLQEELLQTKTQSSVDLVTSWLSVSCPSTLLHGSRNNVLAGRTTHNLWVFGCTTDVAARPHILPGSYKSFTRAVKPVDESHQEAFIIWLLRSKCAVLAW